MSQDTHVRFPNYLFRLRRLRSYSQKQFAMLLGLKSRKAISDLEAGRRLPPLAVGLTMELVLGTKLSEIYSNLYGHLGQQAVSREDLLPPRFTRHIRGRVLGKDSVPEDLPTGDISRFRPTTLRQFLIFHIAFRFDDLRNLGRYLNVCVTPTKAHLLEAARQAEQVAFHDGSLAAQNFWVLLVDEEEEVA